ncbi:MAG: hypothetical protein HOL98_12490 [Gammaproteobacteria bacterium]|nr:hypothetical protein [Gammaproteobacteria bacterium]MBT5204267.1 hypothetical protein [Gammaproteobacteria bacterium]MBT5602160.1 hypothetical protein [Gammaproteobacteria bacterium]MBT6246123.1 hypothetical protein [Gammaproteobacteria bacterium]
MRVKCTFVYWRDIPSQVIVQRGRVRAKVLLSSRFQEAVDRAAMRAGKGSSDAYLSEWRRQTVFEETQESAETLAQVHADRFEAEFTDDALLSLIKGKGQVKQ